MYRLLKLCDQMLLTFCFLIEWAKFTENPICNIFNFNVLKWNVRFDLLLFFKLLCVIFRQVQAVVHDRCWQEQLLEVLCGQPGRWWGGRSHLTLHRLSPGLCQVGNPHESGLLPGGELHTGPEIWFQIRMYPDFTKKKLKNNKTKCKEIALVIKLIWLNFEVNWDQQSS